jgi:bacterioferritin-associated ferredoxin
MSKCCNDGRFPEFSRFVCHCLQVTEEAVLQAIATFDITTIKELRHYTGAGDGCTACHRRLQKYLEPARQMRPLVQASPPSSSSPI